MNVSVILKSGGTWTLAVEGDDAELWFTNFAAQQGTMDVWVEVQPQGRGARRALVRASEIEAVVLTDRS